MTVDKYKARLVAMGNHQRNGIDFDISDVYSPVSSYISLRMLLALAAFYDLEILQIDFKTAFLNGILDIPIFIYPPQSTAQKCKFLKLNKALYGLRQASAAWYKTITKVLIERGYHITPHDPSVFSKSVDGVQVLL